MYDFINTDCGHGMQSAGTPVLGNTIELERKPGRLRRIKEPICSNDNHDERKSWSSPRVFGQLDTAAIKIFTVA